MDANEAAMHCKTTVARLSRLFKPHCRLTLLMRNPEAEDGDILITNDSIGEVIEKLGELEGRVSPADAVRKARGGDAPTPTQGFA